MFLFIKICVILAISMVISLLITNQLKKSYQWKNMSYWWALIFVPPVGFCLWVIWGLIRVIIILAILSAVGFGVYYFYVKKKKADGEKEIEREKIEDTDD